MRRALKAQWHFVHTLETYVVSEGPIYIVLSSIHGLPTLSNTEITPSSYAYELSPDIFSASLSAQRTIHTVHSLAPDASTYNYS